MEGQELLRIEYLRHTYTEGPVETPVLKGVSLTVREGEVLAVIGRSGSGKSTLLHLIGTLDTPTAGSIFFRGRDLGALSATERAAFRNRELGFVYQFHHLLSDFTAEENVMMPLLISGARREAAQAAARELLGKVGLGERLGCLPQELSGGERQRVAIARALANHPCLVLADEPTGNLDAHSAETVFSMFLDLASSAGAAVLMVTHDLALAARCSRQVTLDDGLLREDPR
ncbi:MAG: ABC transporter ATP-binding protein [Succinivibrionaceae bacterium]|nr:ABC transporter ATP-binding protein [Succinivibrionaceae bacterium]